MSGPKRKTGRPVGDTLGGILAGFDQQIMRNSPPAHELVHKGAPVRGLAGDDAGDLTITLSSTDDAPEPTDSDVATPVPAATTDLLDAEPDAYDVCETPLRRFGGVAAFSGRIRTVRCFEDNVLLRGVLETLGQGSVLVVDGGGSLRTALLGDMIAGLAVRNGWAGVVINGCVRDVAALASMPIGLVALGSNPRKSAKTGVGEVDVPVSFGAATFVPGAIVTCDADGLIVTRVVPGA